MTTLFDDYPDFNIEHLSPMFKWTGGKRREISIIEKFFPDFIKRGEKYDFIEPFVGGGAVFWYLNNTTANNMENFYSPVGYGVALAEETSDSIIEQSPMKQETDNFSNQKPLNL